MMSLLKIFVSAYACEPGLGSESGVGWNWISEMSKYFEVWVLTRKSNRPAIQLWMKDNPYHADIHFLYSDLPLWTRFWKKGLRGVHLYYYLWQIYSNRIVKKTMQENGIEIFHHLTYGNALWKVSSYGQKQCFIWGPIGGLETIPVEYTLHYGYKSRFTEWIRRTAVSCINWNTAFRKRCDNASLILCKTDITRKTLPPEYQKKTKTFFDVAMNEFVDCPTRNATRMPLKYLMVGRLDAWRGFDLAIESFTQASKVSPGIHLNIVGKGEDKKRMQALIRKRKMEDKITLYGEVSKSVYETMLADTDAVINASLKEGSVTVSFDCIAYGKPLICLDTTGHTRLLGHHGAIIISRGERESVIRELTDAILQLTKAKTRLEFSIQALNTSTHLTWEEHGKIVRSIINQAYSDYCKDKQTRERKYQSSTPANR